MSQINVQGLISNIGEKTNVYTPIVEAIVNALQSIEENTTGKIRVVVFREKVSQIDLNGDSLPGIRSIEIHDNGIGFNEVNTKSFDTLYSDQKGGIGGKGFGRFFYLKYFDKVEVDSVYNDNGIIKRRTFTFSSKNQPVDSLIENLSIVQESSGYIETIVRLVDLKDSYEFDKKLDTIARILVEKLLPYFVNDSYKCPEIILEENNGEEQIILNEYFDREFYLESQHLK